MKIGIKKILTKKMAAAGLVGVIATSGLVACSKTDKGNTTDTTTTASTTEEVRIISTVDTERISPVILDGWSASDDQKITPKQKAVFDKALEELVGVNYEPVAYLASQVVAGTNHCFLCKATVVRPGATPKYTLVYVYEDLDRKCSIITIKDVEIPGTEGEGEGEGEGKKAGGWTVAENPEITKDLASAVDKAASKKLGAKYVPVANIASQVVSGTNYKIICKVSAESPDSKASFAVVTVYKNLEGECEITDVADIVISADK